jgi:hypothetical protein
MKILFIHHSVGGNLINQGNLREEIRKLNPNIELWDHGYNLYPFLLLSKILGHITFRTGLSDRQGKMAGKDYKITLSNNSPKEYAEIFSRNPNNYTLQSILSYDIIAFKNCFPTTHITSDTQLQKDMEYYRSIRKSLCEYPTKKFIILTPPPVRKEVTTIENARRAKMLASWLISKDFLDNSTNIYVFDFFTLLADQDGMLKQEYTPLIPIDSHPNTKANKTIAPIFAKFISELVKDN